METDGGNHNTYGRCIVLRTRARKPVQVLLLEPSFLHSPLPLWLNTQHSQAGNINRFREGFDQFMAARAAQLFSDHERLPWLLGEHLHV